MTDARFTLTIPALPLDGAQELATSLEEHIALDPLAITINETDEALSLWEVVLFFAEEDEARAARDLIGRGEAVVAALPQQDWVRQSLEGLAPVTAGRFFLHGSHDRPRRRAGGISLEIDAGTAFGTGHHGTTEGCLLALDSILKQHRPAVFWMWAAARAFSPSRRRGRPGGARWQPTSTLRRCGSRSPTPGGTAPLT